MNRKQCEEMLEFLKEEVEIFNKKIEEFKKLETEGYGVWKPKIDEFYYFVNGSGSIECAKWSDLGIEKGRLNFGNVFKNKEEAEYEVECRKVLTELKRFSRKFEIYKNNYCIKYDMISKKINVYNNYVFATSELIFETEKDARDAIASVGEENILKYYLGVKD